MPNLLQPFLPDLSELLPGQSLTRGARAAIPTFRTLAKPFQSPTQLVRQVRAAGFHARTQDLFRVANAVIHHRNNVYLMQQLTPGKRVPLRLATRVNNMQDRRYRYVLSYEVIDNDTGRRHRVFKSVGERRLVSLNKAEQHFEDSLPANTYNFEPVPGTFRLEGVFRTSKRPRLP